MRAISLALLLSCSLFCSCPCSFAFSLVVSLSSSFFHSLPRFFALSLARTCKQRQSLSLLRQKLQPYNTRWATMTLIIIIAIITYLKSKFSTFKLCNISAHRARREKIKTLSWYNSNLSYWLSLLRSLLDLDWYTRFWDSVTMDTCNSPARINRHK